MATERDQRTAAAFATSWNNLPAGSVYTKEQFEDWLSPIKSGDVRKRRILELGCGNASLLYHMAGWEPGYLEGVDLGDSVLSARKNMETSAIRNWKIVQADMTEYRSNGFDLVYCIGVLHHLKEPKRGLDSVIGNTRPGGRFHCWVYAREGNGIIICLVDPIRKFASRLPWWFTKFIIATPLAVPLFIYAKLLKTLKGLPFAEKFPLYRYGLWIAQREFAFFRHVAFDQLVSPLTGYISRGTITRWLDSYDCIDKSSIYVVMRNGNSWKFGGQVLSHTPVVRK
jgi:SAM-dependent methyltransferase